MTALRASEVLFPCPFCGGEADLCRTQALRHYGVMCAGDDCSVNPETRLYKTRTEAVDAWNARKPMRPADPKGEE